MSKHLWLLFHALDDCLTIWQTNEKMLMNLHQHLKFKCWQNFITYLANFLVCLLGFDLNADFRLIHQICKLFLRYFTFLYAKQINVHIPLRSHCWTTPSACPASCPSCRASQVWSAQVSTDNIPRSQPAVPSPTPLGHTIAQCKYHSTPCIVETCGNHVCCHYRI